MGLHRRLSGIAVSAALIVSSFSGITAVADDTDDINVQTASASDTDKTTDAAVTELPEWIPNDISEAMEFDRKYGAVHIESGYICCVCRMLNNGEGYVQHTALKKYGDTEDQDYIVSDRLITDETSSAGLCYRVYVLRPESDSDLDVSWTYPDSDSNGPYGKKHTFSFVTDSANNIKEEDIFSWIPDSVEEAEAYKSKHGIVSLRDEYIVYCNTWNAGTGFSVEADGRGIPKISEAMHITAEEPYSEPVDGGECADIILYRANRPGTVLMSFVYGSETAPEDEKDKAYYTYRIDNDLKFEEIISDELDTLVTGDCNYDGAIGLSDYITLKKWLQGNDVEICADNCDINYDRAIDVFDLICLKKILLNGNKNFDGLVADAKPMLAVVYELGEPGAGQQITVYDENGKGYTMGYLHPTESGSDNYYDEFIDMNDDGKWYNDIISIINNEKAVKTEMPDEMIRTTRNESEYIASHFMDRKGQSYSRSHYSGTTTVYLIGKDTQEKPVNLRIFSWGDELFWLDCRIIKDYVKTACHSGFLTTYDNIRLLEKNGMTVYIDDIKVN